MASKIIAVDFDGTLCQNAWPEIGAPNEAVIDYVLYQQCTGAKLILWTCRVGDKLQAAVDWCREYGIVFDAINENLTNIVRAFGGDCRKVYADEYLDDKMMPLPVEISRRRRRTINFKSPVVIDQGGDRLNLSKS